MSHVIFFIYKGHKEVFFFLCFYIPDNLKPYFQQLYKTQLLKFLDLCSIIKVLGIDIDLFLVCFLAELFL